MIPLSWKLVALSSAVVLSFATGWQVHSWKVDAGMLEAMQAHVQQWRESQDKTDDLASKLEIEEQKQKIVARTITKEVVKYAQNPDIGHCTLPVEFGMLFNSAAEGTAPPASEATPATGGTSDTSDSSVLEVATENFSQCREWRASLIGWQEWYKSVSD